MILRILSLLLVVFVLGSCDNSANEDPRFVLKLIDAAGDYEQVNIEVIGAEVNVNGEWQTLNVEPDVYDLCELTNGTSAILADESIPAGDISQLRLILGENNTLKLKDQEELVDLTTPSGQTSGLKINIQETLTEGITYTLMLDFDAAKSVVKAGNSGKYNLKPVIRAFPEALDGAISGSIEPADASPAIYAIVGEDTITSTFSDDDGFFMLRGLDAETYTVGIEPDPEAYEKLVVEEVSVSIGQITDIGTQTLEAVSGE